MLDEGVHNIVDALGDYYDVVALLEGEGLQHVYIPLGYAGGGHAEAVLLHAEGDDAADELHARERGGLERRKREREIKREREEREREREIMHLFIFTWGGNVSFLRHSAHFTVHQIMLAALEHCELDGM